MASMHSRVVVTAVVVVLLAARHRNIVVDRHFEGMFNVNPVW